ncbi:MAG TPA: hypothetical protein VN258_01905 [Mobilitalea sp.]|nr:hypothetical protein [Mobilitalea sp.]
MEIEGSQPPIWRRILIPDRINFRQLHRTEDMLNPL